MEIKISFLSLIVFVLLLTSCNDKSKPASQVETPEGFSTTGIDSKTMDMLLAKGDHIDYIFHKLPLSMNQDGRNAMFKEMGFISKNALSSIPVNCLPMARKIYIGNGEIIMESDLYFSQDCLFQVFIMDEKPLFANELSQEGINFYAGLMRQAKETMPQNVQEKYSNTIPAEN